MKMDIRNLSKNVVKNEIWFIVWMSAMELIRVIQYMNQGKMKDYSPAYYKMDFIFWGFTIVFIMSIVQKIVRDKDKKK